MLLKNQNHVSISDEHYKTKNQHKNKDQNSAFFKHKGKKVRTRQNCFKMEQLFLYPNVQACRSSPKHPPSLHTNDDSIQSSTKDDPTISQTTSTSKNSLTNQ